MRPIDVTKQQSWNELNQISCLQGGGGDLREQLTRGGFLLFFWDWDSLHASLNTHYEAWSYKKKKRKKI